MGDEVTFTRGNLVGQRYVITKIGKSGPKFVDGGLSLDLQSLIDKSPLYVDGDDLGDIKIVKRVPAGLRVIRFKP